MKPFGENPTKAMEDIKSGLINMARSLSLAAIFASVVAGKVDAALEALSELPIEYRNTIKKSALAVIALCEEADREVKTSERVKVEDGVLLVDGK